MIMDAKQRKERPVYTGVLKYFPDAIMEVAKVSLAGNQQHHADKPLHWDRAKSTDELDALARHLIDAGKLDDDGQRHSAKVAWRALANLQKEIEAERKITKKAKDYKIQPGDAGTEAAYLL
jgi:hypothetical protein